MALRKTVSDGCEKLIEDFFEAGGQVVIYDANNGSRTTRQALAEKYDKQGIHVIILGMSHHDVHWATITYFPSV
jgi:6-phosphofructo-2-kinase/fructose-2,6-biphosphatase 4